MEVPLGVVGSPVKVSLAGVTSRNLGLAIALEIADPESLVLSLAALRLWPVSVPWEEAGVGVAVGVVVVSVGFASLYS